eukprot:COSAG01_NODE_45117_length_412_cov_1.115016_1_plen_76_part_10
MLLFMMCGTFSSIAAFFTLTSRIRFWFRFRVSRRAVTLLAGGGEVTHASDVCSRFRHLLQLFHLGRWLTGAHRRPP